MFTYPNPAKTFISDSGFTYTIDEIVDYMKGGKTFEVKCFDLNYEVNCYFRDFKNISDKRIYTPQLFSENDIKRLLQYEDIKTFYTSKPGYKTLEKAFEKHYISDTLINLLEDLADRAKLLSNINNVLDPIKLYSILSVPMARLYKYINEKMDPFEQNALKLITKPGGAVDCYFRFRDGKNFIEDIKDIVEKGSCTAGIEYQITNLYAVLKSQQMFVKCQPSFSLSRK